MRKKESLLLALLGIAHSLNHSLFLVLPLYLTDVVNEFMTTKEAVGLMAAISGFIYGAGALVGGALSDRIGEVKTLFLSLALAGASTFIFPLAHGLLAFSVALICMSSWASLYHPTANSLISKVFRTNMAEAMGLHGTGGNVGFMFAPIVAVAIGNAWGWRYPLMLFGALSIIISALILRAADAPLTGQVKVRTYDVVKAPGLWTLLAYNVAVGLYFKGVEFMLPTFLRHVFGFPSTLVATSVFLVLAIGILGQWIGGKASDSIGPKGALVTTSAGVPISLLLLLTIPNPSISVLSFVLIYGLCFYGHQPALNSFAGLITSEEMRGAAFGMLFFSSFGLGSISIAIASSLADRYGLEASFYVMMIFSTIALLSSFLTPTQAKKMKA